MHDPLAYATPPLSLTSTTRVANVHPTLPVDYRLAIVGEAPGADEEAYGTPFVGASGRFLDSILSSAGILRAGCYVGNICQHRPPNNEIKLWGYAHEHVLAGWEVTRNELIALRPNCILALGNTPLHFLTSKTGIESWRGSILWSRVTNCKVVPAVHPAAILRGKYKSWKFLLHDVIRARQEAASPELLLPQRTLELNLTANEICHNLDTWPTRQLLSFDIEGGLDAFPCCSVASTATQGFIIAWSRFDATDQGRVAQSLSRVLYRIDVPKCLQNSLYDRFVLAYGYQLIIRNVTEDTMLKHWEKYPEASGKKVDDEAGGKSKKGVGKDLGTIASIWTREPYYKFERKSDDPEKFYEYCIKDSCVTLEACQKMDQALDERAVRNYRFNISLLDPLLYMQLRGISYNKPAASEQLSQVSLALDETGTRLETQVLPFYATKKEPLTTRIRGEGGSLGDKRLMHVLYEQKNYPIQHKRDAKTKKNKPTADVDALLKLFKKRQSDTFLRDVLLHRKLESLSETLSIDTDPDGRVRCAYNLVGTETARLSCYTSPTGSGTNMQTITSKLRRLFVADPGHYIFQCDLKGADGWTVAARCLLHGDSTMWDDYNNGLKPAKIVALMYEHGTEATRCTRDELKARCAAVDEAGWLYFGCKRVQHATNYGVTPKTISDQLMVDSYKKTGTAIYVAVDVCAALQQLYLIRYPGVYQWHEWAKREVEAGRNLTTASGHTRTFFGRRRSWDNKLKCMAADHETWKEFLADEPQENTSYANNSAMWNLWYDPSNSLVPSAHHPLPNGGVLVNQRRVEPLHTMHDAIIGQFRIEDLDWALPKIRSWYDTKMHIAGVEVVIPFDGAYGPSWGELGEKHGGGLI